MKTNSIPLVLEIWDRLASDTNTPRGYVTEQDRSYVRKRVTREGLMFLTKVLPLLGKSLEKGMATGIYQLPEAFKPYPGTELPRLLYQCFTLIFTDEGKLRDLSTPFQGTELGQLIQEPSATACFIIRQLTLLCYKMKLDYLPEQKAAVKAAFHANEDHCWEWTVKGPSQWSESPIMERARRFVRRLVSGVSPFDIKPAHGGGACSEVRDPWLRYKPERFIPKLDARFPYTEFFCTMPDGMCALSEWLRTAETVEDPPARVIFVPKDSRGPRLISAEPSEFMFIQQGLMSALYGAINRYPDVREMLDCLDQTRNQRAARAGSITGDLATLDMKDASDCISYALVRFLFPEDWVAAFEACRSETTVFPDGEEVFLWKFAPMGSAVCFPVEAIIFWAITLAVCQPDYKVGERNRRIHTPEISIFGDDIVCPAGYADKVCLALESAGLKVNYDKSFVSGPFRESCGSDWFHGYCVRIVRLNHLPEYEGTKLTIASAFRLLDFFREVQKQTGSMNDRFWADLMERETGHELPITRESVPGTYSLGSSVLQPTKTSERPLKRRKRHSQKFVEYNGRYLYLFQEKGVTRRVDTGDRSHLLRAMLGKAGEQAEVVGLKDRTWYNQDWVRVN